MLSLDETCQYLRKSKFFASASDDTVKSLADLAELIRIEAGEKLFDKGEIGTAMYFVVDGCVRIHNEDVVITHLGKGQVFGEVAALSQELRTAAVTAEMDTALIKLEQTAIYNTLSSQPDAAKCLIQALCKRESEIIEEKFDRLVKAKVMENELDIGQKIQRNFLPEVIPEIDGWAMKGLLQPARKVAGDFFDFFVVPKPSCIGIVIGDVCDKGLGAALFMTLFRSLIRSIAVYRNVVGENPPTPAAACSHPSFSGCSYLRLASFVILMPATSHPSSLAPPAYARNWPRQARLLACLKMPSMMSPWRKSFLGKCCLDILTAQLMPKMRQANNSLKKGLWPLPARAPGTAKPC
jgi:CRP-like cAMP-binding protein